MSNFHNIEESIHTPVRIFLIPLSSLFFLLLWSCLLPMSAIYHHGHTLDHWLLSILNLHVNISAFCVSSLFSLIYNFQKYLRHKVFWLHNLKNVSQCSGYENVLLSSLKPGKLTDQRPFCCFLWSMLALKAGAKLPTVCSPLTPSQQGCCAKTVPGRSRNPLMDDFVS